LVDGTNAFDTSASAGRTWPVTTSRAPACESARMSEPNQLGVATMSSSEKATMSNRDAAIPALRALDAPRRDVHR